MSTPDDAGATIILSDIGLKVALPFEGKIDNLHPAGVYSLCGLPGGIQVSSMSVLINITSHALSP